MSKAGQETSLLKPLRYIATGTGRCGTASVARLLTSAGVVCGHEHIFQMSGFNPTKYAPWGKDWSEVQAESSWPAALHLDHPILEKATLIHICRHPLLVARSMLYLAGKRGNLDGSLRRWLAYNQLIDDAREGWPNDAVQYRIGIDDPLWLLYRIKALSLVYPDALGLDGALEIVNARTPADFPVPSWDDVKDGRLRELVRAYSVQQWGYHETEIE